VQDHEREFDKELTGLRAKLLSMGEIAQDMVRRATAALVQRDAKLIQTLPRQEQQVNALQLEIDDLGVTLVATHQPVATDLRFLMAATKINSELERIGDLAMNIQESVHGLLHDEPVKPLVDIPRMDEIARQMVRESLEAMVRTDALLAQSVIMRDDEVDALKDQVLRELLTYMAADPRVIERGLSLILVARHLERIADHATNIAQDVIYLIQGRDVRHPKTRDDRAHPGQGVSRQ